MRILAVDSTTEYLDMALVEDGRAVQKRVRASRAQDEKLFTVLNPLLEKAGWKLQDLDLLVASSGPGSFTGIRVGMTFIALLARTLRKPAVGVGLLEAQAVSAVDASGPAKRLIGAVLPAPRDEIFFQTFEGSSGRPFSEPEWVHPSRWPTVFREFTSGRPTVLIGPHAKAALRHFPVRPKNLAGVIDSKAPRAKDLAAPGLDRYRNKKLDELAPLYLRPAYYERGGARLGR